MHKEEVGILLVVLFAMLILTSCSPEDPAPAKSTVTLEEPEEEPKPEPEEEFVPYKEKVCIEVNGKEKCRTITKHKKHEGTKIK